jgi:predicted DNA-binding transcriptional regulator YafY
VKDNIRNIYESPGLKLLKLYVLLVSHSRSYSLKRLAEIFTCSRQTILRLIEQLQKYREIEIIPTMEGKERFYSVAPRPTPTGFSFTPDTIGYISLGLCILRDLLPESVQNELQDMIGSNRAVNLRDAERKPELLAEPWVKGRIDYAPFRGIIDDIQTAMRERRLCRIEYSSHSQGEKLSLLIAPIRIIVYREAMYLRCRVYDPDPEKYACPKEHRNLAIQRIRKLSIDKNTFADEPTSDPDPAFGFQYHDPIKVRAAFWDGAASYVRERIWSPDQKITIRKDGALILTFTTTSRLEVISWILSFGPDAELLEPEDLRETMLQKSAGIYERYTGAKSMQSISEHPKG